MFQALRERFSGHKKVDLATFTEQWLTPALKRTLASLDGSPDDAVEAVIQLLPLGSRTALARTEPALAIETVSKNDLRYLELTAFGREVIAFLASTATSSAARPDAGGGVPESSGELLHHDHC